MHQVPSSGSDRCVAPDGHPVRGTASVKIRAISGPAVPPKPRQTPLALVSDALPLYHQRTKNLLVSYSPKKFGFFQTHGKRRLTGLSTVRRLSGGPLVPDQSRPRPRRPVSLSWPTVNRPFQERS